MVYTVLDRVLEKTIKWYEDSNNLKFFRVNEYNI